MIIYIPDLRIGCHPTFFFKSFYFIYLREREHEQGEGQRERETESLADSVLSMEPDMGLDPTTLRA